MTHSQKHKVSAAKRHREETQTLENNINEILIPQLKQYKIEFDSSNTNKIIQNALCSNHLFQVAEERLYMQSLDKKFSHTLDPQLVVCDQGYTGRCWMFALLNIIRHDLIRFYDLPLDFELSESYISFYEKLEKCNYVLTYFIEKNEIIANDYKTCSMLLSKTTDGGLWNTCVNLIKKYGIVPKSCFRESVHSSNTAELNDILGYKIRQFSLELTQEPNKTKRIGMKENMMKIIYMILVKMLGTPPSVDEKITWTYSLRQDIIDQLEIETKRKEKGFESLTIKKTVNITPIEFYKKYVPNKLDDYCLLGDDPRNEYNKFYVSHETDIVTGAERNGHFNLPINDIADYISDSIKNNMPCEMDIDAGKFLHHREDLLDDKCFNYDNILGTKIGDLTKKQGLECLESYPNHAVIIVGVDVGDGGTIHKWKIENSWGQKIEDLIMQKKDAGYYTMSHDWFKKYSFAYVVHKNFIPKKVYENYLAQKQNPIMLRENDIFS